MHHWRMPYDSDHVGFQSGFLRGISERRASWRLQPARIVNSGDRRMLRPKFRLRIPAGVEQNKQRFDVMPRRNLQELIDAFLEALRILLPQQIMKEDAHRVHPRVLGPPKFLVNLGGIECLCLPHLEFVDGIGRNVIAANDPWLLVIP